MQVTPGERSRAGTFAAVGVGALAFILVAIAAGTLLLCGGYLTVKATTADATRERRVEACRVAAAKEHVEWYYTDREGCIGKGVFGIHVPLDIDSPEFHK